MANERNCIICGVTIPAKAIAFCNQCAGLVLASRYAQTEEARAAAENAMDNLRKRNSAALADVEASQ